MAERHQFLGDPMDDALGSSVQLGRDGFGQRRDLSNAHASSCSKQNATHPRDVPVRAM